MMPVARGQEVPPPAPAPQAVRIALNETAFREAGHSSQLQRARQALAAGREIAGLSYLQQILDAPVDAFVWNRETGRLRGARALAAGILDQQPPQVQAAYERLYGPDAARLLKDVAEQHSPVLLQEIGRRYFHTSAGFRALTLRAEALLDGGRFAEASRLYDNLISASIHRRRITPLLLAKASLARRLGWNDGSIHQLVRQNEPSAVQVADSSVHPVAWETAASFSGDSAAARGFGRQAPAEWPVPLGDASHNRAAAGSPPWLRPAWRHDLLAGCHEYVEQMLSEWEEQQQRTDQPLAQAVHGIVASGQLIIRDPDGIRAIEPNSGQLLWRYRCASALSEAARRSSGRFGNSRSRSSRSATWVDFAAARVRNSVLGMLSSNGEYVFAVDHVELLNLRQGAPLPRGDSATSPVEQLEKSRRTNRLIALSLNSLTAGSQEEPATPQLMWSAGGELPEDGNEQGTSRLAGHYFFGPPMPSGDRLYAVSERQGILFLNCLDAADGTVVWMQSLGYASVPVESDSRRYPAACLPAISAGTAVCPTQQGILVGVDTETGSLEWVYFYGDYSDTATARSWTQRNHRLHGHGGFPSPPVIAGRRVVYLPRESSSIHCVDLRTGQSAWRSRLPSRKDAEYIAGVQQDIILLVGSRYCRGLSLENGRELWSTRISLPSGRGLCLNSSLLVPLQEGRVAMLDIVTGREIGQGLSVGELIQSTETSPVENGSANRPAAELKSVARTSHPHWTGNLLASGGMIYSTTPREVVAFPQAARRLQQMQLTIAADGLSAEAALTAAELEMTLGRLRPAQQNLQHTLYSSPSPQQKSRAEYLLRETIYRSLTEQNTDTASQLGRLSALAHTPDQRCRYLMALARFQFEQRNFNELMLALEELNSLSLKVTGNTRHSVSVAAWIAGLAEQVPQTFSGNELDQARTSVEIAQAEALATDTEESLNSFLTMLGCWPQAQEVQLRLAEKRLDAGELQQAELLLLQVLTGEDRELVREAALLQARLCDRTGLAEEAVHVLEQYNLTVAQPAASRKERLSALTAAAHRRSLPVRWPVSRVRISGDSLDAGAAQLRDDLHRYRRRFLTPAHSGFLLLDQGTNREGSISVISRAGGVVSGRVRIPSRNSYPSLARDAHVGHFFPLGGNGSMHGISLLSLDDGDPLWTVTTDERENIHEVMRVGPAGPGFCTFQRQRELIVLSPHNGELMWRRDDLEPHSGLLSDPYTGLYGDDQTLVVFGPDHETWTAYRTSTGEELQTGRLPIDRRAQRRVWGRKLLYFTEAGQDEKRQLRIWDALTDSCVLDRTVYGRVQTAETGQDRLVVVESKLAGDSAGNQLPALSAGGRIQVIDPATGKIELSVRLTADETESLSYVRVFSDRHRWYFSFQKAVRHAEQRRRSYYASDTFLPATHVQGTLFAVDRQSGKRLWSRVMPQRTVLDLAHLNLPFLVTVSRIRDREQGSRQSLLVELLDAATGQTIGSRDNLFPDRIVHLSCEPEQGHLVLRGLRSAIHLDFSRRVQALELLNGPF
ncbi:MAG: PQQ-like beta-propeller repeat protein [Planctomycetaceae bacterium]|nr:PQQ-like beta-propeller repeat protein [Planctomycetaceae bacterium]